MLTVDTTQDVKGNTTGQLVVAQVESVKPLQAGELDPLQGQGAGQLVATEGGKLLIPEQLVAHCDSCQWKLSSPTRCLKWYSASNRHRCDDRLPNMPDTL
jgi:hypothetical protein